MKKILVLSLGLLVAPTVVAAQVEIGLDAGLAISKIDDADDTGIGFAIPTSGMRIGFAAGEMIMIETLLDLGYFKAGDLSLTSLSLVPGLNILLGDQFYVRPEAGLAYTSADDGTGSESATQFLFGGGVGIRKPLGDGALLRLEGAVDRLLENTDDFIPASWNIRFVVGVSAVIR